MNAHSTVPMVLDERAFTNIGEHLNNIVESYPDRVAIHTEREELTYREFNEKVNQIAHAILAQTNGTEERIALFSIKVRMLLLLCLQPSKLVVYLCT